MLKGIRDVGLKLDGMTIEGKEKVTVAFPWSAVLTVLLALMATVFVIYDATQDLKIAIDNLTAVVSQVQGEVRANGESIHSLDKRVTVVESKLD
jgi:hypothetical protein